MAVPLTLSSVPAQTPYVQYVATASQTVFPYPFEITQDSDLVCLINGVQQATDSGYTLSGQGATGGGNLTFTVGQTAGTIVTLYRNIAIARITQFAQNGTFFSANFNNEFNRIYLIMQQLQEAASFALQVPNTNNPAPITTLTPAAYANKYLAFDANGNPEPADLTSSGSLTASIINALLAGSGTRTTAEINAGVTPVNYLYAPGNPRRYGAVGDGITDDTAALTTAISCNTAISFEQGDVYGVSTVVFPSPGPSEYRFNGAIIRGISTSAKNCALQIETNHATIYDLRVDTYNAVSNPNTNYVCAVWWSNNAGTQWNTLFGCEINYAVRGMVYGQLPGNAATSVIQSENVIYGWSTQGVSNPFYGNSIEGFLHFAAPIFDIDLTSWTTPTYTSSMRCLENIVGAISVHGGEMVFSASTTPTYGCELQNCILSGMYWEGASPAGICGDGVKITGGNYLNTQANTSAFQIESGVTGVLNIDGMVFERETGVGASSGTAMIDATLSAANSTGTPFETILSNTQSFEWRWQLVGGNARLVNGGVVRYRNHRLSITATDANVYMLNNNPTEALYSDAAFDHMGYTTTGWVLNSGAGGTTMTSTTSTGPAGYLASQITLTSTGQALAYSIDTTNAATCAATGLHVRPGEAYWLSAWVKLSSGTIAQLTASFYTLAGAGISSIEVADQTAIGSNVWSFVEGPVVAPATAAFMGIGVNTTGTSTILVTDIRVHRAN